MSPQATTTEKPKRERPPSVRISKETAAKLDQFGQKVSEAIQAGPYKLPPPDHGALIGILVDSALESENGAG